MNINDFAIFENPNVQYNYYNNLSEKSKLLVRNNDYLKIISDFLTEMFVIDTLTPAQTALLLKTIMRNGTALLERTPDNKYIIAPCHYVGYPKPTEIFPDEICSTRYDWSYTGKIKDNQAVVYFTPDRTSLSIINRFVTHLAQVDTSLSNNVLFCRISPIISACTSNSKVMYENIIDRMIDGEVKNVITDTINPLTNTTAPLTVTDISSADYADKIQYLSMLHQDLLSRLCMLFGIDYKHHDKQANLIKDEMQNGDEYMRVYPRMMLKCLNESLEPLALKAHFNSIWEKLNIPETEIAEITDSEESSETSDSEEISETSDSEESSELSDSEESEAADGEEK